MMDIGFRKAQRIIWEEEVKSGLRPGDLSSNLRTKSITATRKLALSRVRKETSLSWREIGIMLGYKGKPPWARRKSY